MNIELNNTGAIAIVDDEDYPLVKEYRWYSVTFPNGGWNTYAETRIGKKKVRMHTLITGIAGIDHVNGNGLDNRRSNLRPADHSQNAMNRRKITGTSSRYKGVGYHKYLQKWRAYIKVNGRSISLGYFDNEKDAALAYDEAARRYFGKYARPNFEE
jgi:hypothetical protein